MEFETIIPVFLLRNHAFTLAFNYLASIQFNYYKNGHANIGVFLNSTPVRQVKLKVYAGDLRRTCHYFQTGMKGTQGTIKLGPNFPLDGGGSYRDGDKMLLL